MKIFSGLMCLMLLTSWNAMAEAIAPSVPYSASYLQKTGKSADELNAKLYAKNPIPTKEEVKVPAYPGSFYYQSNSGMDGELLSVVLVSKDDPDTVRAWYKKNYSGTRKVSVKPFTLYEWMLQLKDLKGMKAEIWIDMD
ncbi:MAG: hypothetical protein R8L58_07345 [Mariprofundaceae bacterium]